MKLKVKAIITAFMLTVLLNAEVRAQQNRSFAEHIRTVETIVNDDRTLPPVISLNAGDKVSVSFDDITRATYISSSIATATGKQLKAFSRAIT